MSVYDEDPETGLPREKAQPENTLRLRIIAQLRTYPPGCRGPGAKDVAAGLADKPPWRTVLTELHDMRREGLVAFWELRGVMHWGLTAKGRRVTSNG